jgi:hypothetical protein
VRILIVTAAQADVGVAGAFDVVAEIHPFFPHGMDLLPQRSCYSVTPLLAMLARRASERIYLIDQEDPLETDPLACASG